MKSYDHKAIEQKWQEAWRDAHAFETSDHVDGKENEYILFEFPYPSGNLHVGHWYAFALTDIYARFRRLQGKNVLFPIGFDAFGLPAENAAIKHNLNPREWTYQNMDTMRTQLQSMGGTFDWSREVITCDPAYYKWTQYLFLELYKAGLVQKKITTVNWDPVDKTVLANEQVLPDGRAERSGALVEQKELEQWTINITKYADRLLEDVDALNWPTPIKDAQRNWIGKSEGAYITFVLANHSETIRVFTTRPDTLFGVTYLVLAPEHAHVEQLLPSIANKEAAEAYITQSKRRTERDRLIGDTQKTGVCLEGIFAINPATQEQVPVYIADYVLAGYGTGAIMAVPAHDERDHAFAELFKLPIKNVVAPRLIDERNPHVPGKEVVFREGIIAVVYNPKDDTYLTLNWPEQKWVTFVVGGMEEGEDPVEAAHREIIEETGYTNISYTRRLFGPTHTEFFAAHKNINRIAQSHVVLFTLIDETRVAVNEEESSLHNVSWVPKSALTTDMTHVEMKYILESLASGKERVVTEEGILINSGSFNGLTSAQARKQITESVNGELASTYKLRDWIVSRQRYWGCPIPMINCASCGSVPVPPEQLPVVLPDIDDFLPRDDGKSPLAKAVDWMHTNCPSCNGAAERETDTLDTFVDSSWYFLRYTDPQNTAQFADSNKLAVWMPVNFYSGGAEHTTMHLLYARFFHKALFDLGLVPASEPFTQRLNRGLILGTDGNKMSKSKGNVIDPDKEVERLGSDTVRSYLAFIGPYNEPGNYPWDPNGIVGVRRFIERAATITEHIVPQTPETVTRALHQSIKKVTEDTIRLKFNTAIAQLMTLVSAIMKEGISKEDAQIFAILLTPFAPHLAEEVWQELGGAGFVQAQKWPIHDSAVLITDTVQIAIQVNGKVRSHVEMSPQATQQEVEDVALAQEQVTRWLEGKTPKKVIYVQGKILSLVA